MAWRTDLTRTNMLVKFRDLRVQLASIALILSRRSFQETFQMVPYLSKTPKYLEGMVPLGKPRILPIFLWVIVGVLKKNSWDLSALIARPDALAKSVRINLKAWASWTEGCPISIVSSMNCWWDYFSISSWSTRPLILPASACDWMSLLNPSPTRTKRNRESRSTCLIPLVGENSVDGDPFKRME